nr:MAG TPA_asm: hypothetical protein [Caudoviricetes sp.]
MYISVLCRKNKGCHFSRFWQNVIGVYPSFIFVI